MSSADGTLLLGASSLSGRTWQGSVWIYREPEQAPSEGFCRAGVQTEAGITDVKWVTEKAIVAASDSGASQMILTTKNSRFNTLQTFCYNLNWLFLQM